MQLGAEWMQMLPRTGGILLTWNSNGFIPLVISVKKFLHEQNLIYSHSHSCTICRQISLPYSSFIKFPHKKKWSYLNFKELLNNDYKITDFPMIHILLKAQSPKLRHKRLRYNKRKWHLKWEFWTSYSGSGWMILRYQSPKSYILTGENCKRSVIQRDIREIDCDQVSNTYKK